MLVVLLMLLEHGTGEEALVEFSWHQKGSWRGSGTSQGVHITAQVVGAPTPQLILEHDDAAGHGTLNCRQHFSFHFR